MSQNGKNEDGVLKTNEPNKSRTGAMWLVVLRRAQFVLRGEKIRIN